MKTTTFGGDPDPRGPAFSASRAGECSNCGEWFEEGAMIRADGEGDWECADHKEEEGD